MSAGLISMSASASATERLTTRQSLSSSSHPPTPVSTSSAPAWWVTTNPCTGQVDPATSRSARCNRLISATPRHLSLVRLGRTYLFRAHDVHPHGAVPVDQAQVRRARSEGAARERGQLRGGHPAKRLLLPGSLL